MSVAVPTQLGTEKISKLLKQYAIPGIIAMTASSLYNIVDSIFIGHGVGTYAIAGLALTFPLMNLSAAFGSLVGLGGATILSVLLGQKNYAIAQKVLGNVVSLNLIIGFLYALFMLVFLEPVLHFFGASELTMPYAKEYMEVILYGNVITHMYFGLNGMQRSAGFPKKAMMATIFTVVINTLLDPLFIYVFDMGIRGAAIATILSQLLSLLWIIYHFSNKSQIIHFKRGIYKIEKRIFNDIMSVGMSPFLMNAAACGVIMIINNGLKEYGGDLSIAAYGIINRVAFIFLMIVMGLNQGLQPIAGYNYGAKNMDRVWRALKLTIFCGMSITTMGFLAGMLFPATITKIFTTDQELIDITVHGMRLVFVMFPIIGFQMVVSNFFQSLGMAKISIFLSLSRQLIILLPLLIILPKFFGVAGVWVSLPIADGMACVIAACILIYQTKKLKNINYEA